MAIFKDAVLKTSIYSETKKQHLIEMFTSLQRMENEGKLADMFFKHVLEEIQTNIYTLDYTD
jgi:hypothetical protein